MNTSPFIWLGANRARKWPVGEKGQRLDYAAHAGLPVPAGAILLDEFYQLLLAEGVVTNRIGQVQITDDDWLYETLYEGAHFPRPDGLVAVRGAFSPPGTAVPQLNINFTDAGELATALRAVWSAAGHKAVRRDVLVMDMIKKEALGTAVTATNAATDTITWASSTLQLPQLGVFGRPEASAPPFVRRLQMLLRGVRRTFGKGTWRLDWLDDGQICWLIQLH